MKNRGVSISLLILLASVLGSHSTWAISLKEWAASNPAKLRQTSAWRELEKTELGSASVAADAVTMKKARDLFAKENFAGALALYEQISASSPYWLEAVEEKAWIFHRQKEFDRALAQTKTLMSQALVPVVGSEPFFLRSLTLLKVCDYKSILETHQLFKNSQRQRLLDLKALEEIGDSPALQSVLQRADQFPLSFQSVGEEAKALPRQFYRDRQLQSAMMRLRLAELAGLSGERQKAQKDLRLRIQALARVENAENFKIVQKLNLIEVETIQRLHADRERGTSEFQKSEFKTASRDQMVFPDDGHPWIDELDKYQVELNACPQNIRRKM